MRTLLRVSCFALVLAVGGCSTSTDNNSKSASTDPSSTDKSSDSMPAECRTHQWKVGTDLSSYDSDCKGNVGCKELAVKCGYCACVQCWNESCVHELCDDGGPGCGGHNPFDPPDAGGSGAD